MTNDKWNFPIPNSASLFSLFLECSQNRLRMIQKTPSNIVKVPHIKCEKFITIQSFLLSKNQIFNKVIQFGILIEIPFIRGRSPINYFFEFRGNILDRINL